MIEIRTDIVIGVITGLIAGLCVFFGQAIARVSNQENNILLVAGVALISATIILLLALRKRTKKKDKKNNLVNIVKRGKIAKNRSTKITKSKIYELILLTIYALATVLIAYATITQLPIIGENLRQPKLFIDIENQVYGDYIPVKIYNYGSGPATNVTISIKSCVMDKPLLFYTESLAPDGVYEVKFRESRTITDFKKLDCRGGEGINLSQYGSMEIMTYKNTLSGEILTPSIEKTLDVCGHCYWDINITTQQGNFFQRVSTYSTIGLSIDVKGNEFNIDDQFIEPYSPIGIALFDQEMLAKQGYFLG